MPEEKLIENLIKLRKMGHMIQDSVCPTRVRIIYKWFMEVSQTPLLYNHGCSHVEAKCKIYFLTNHSLAFRQYFHTKTPLIHKVKLRNLTLAKNCRMEYLENNANGEVCFAPLEKFLWTPVSQMP